jgi:hypothetical protein
MRTRSLVVAVALLAGCASVPSSQARLPRTAHVASSEATPAVAVVSTNAPASRETAVSQRARWRRPRSSWRPASAPALAASGDRRGEPRPPQDSPWWRGPDGLAFAGASADHPDRLDPIERSPLGEVIAKRVSNLLGLDRPVGSLSTSEFVELLAMKVLCAPLGLDLASIWDDFMERYEHVSDRRALRAKLLDEANGGGEPDDDGPTPDESLDAYDAYLRARHRDAQTLPGEKLRGTPDANR